MRPAGTGPWELMAFGHIWGLAGKGSTALARTETAEEVS